MQSKADIMPCSIVFQIIFQSLNHNVGRVVPAHGIYGYDELTHQRFSHSAMHIEEFPSYAYRSFRGYQMLGNSKLP